MSKIKKEFPRLIANKINSLLKKKSSILLLGPRQTGKSTLIKKSENALYINLALNRERRRFEKDPDLLIDEIRAIEIVGKKTPLVIIDEIQKVPELLDSIQVIIDDHLAQTIITGSSARKLKKQASLNLLPGRVVSLRMDPLSLSEIPPKTNLENLLYYGSLPAIFQEVDEKSKTELLRSYVDIYLEEEVRMEGLVRSLPIFSRFLELAAMESGKIISFNSISQELGVAHTTISGYYELLVDCLIAERIEPIYQSLSRKKLIRSNRYLFFDLGVRRIAANEGISATPERKGELLEHFVGLEILRFIRNDYPLTKLCFWRDPDGPEVDWVLTHENNKYIPFEVKLKSKPGISDVKHLVTFMNEYPCLKYGYIVCTTPRRFRITDHIIALPWHDLPTELKNILK
jgi:predicted AAA+ superfamily ATPase